MANRIDFQIGYNLNQSDLNKIKSSLQQLQKLTANDLDLAKGLNADQANAKLKDIHTSAKKVEDALNKAFNKDLGTLNISKFNNELKKLNLNKIYTDFSNAGAAGQKAFRDITAQVLTTNMQLKQTHSFIDNIATTMSNTIKWGLASSAMNTFTGSVQQAWGYVKGLDSSLNDIRIVTQKSSEDMADFARTANTAAKALGTGTKDFTNASLIYYQQGLSDEEVQARTEVTMKTANVTKQSASEVSEQLTAVWNGYKATADEAERYVDKVAAVASKSASSLAELTTGMSKVASAANSMGVDFDQLNAQMSTIISVTRQAPESVGTALKTIYARMGDLKVSGVDEFGTTLGKISGQMAQMGIQVTDEMGNLRDMGEVIEEVAGKWGTWTAAQKQAAAVAMAGSRQYNNLIALFDNWDKYTSALTTSQNAIGTLQKQQDIYLERTEAKLAQLGAAAEDVYDSLLNTETINPLIEALTWIVDKTASAIDSIGGGSTILLALGSIATKVLSKNIAEGLFKTIENFQNAKYNASQFNAELEIMQRFKGINITDADTKVLINMKQQALDLNTVLTEEQNNAINGMIKQTKELQDQKAKWEENKRAAEEYMRTARNENINITGITRDSVDYKKITKEVEDSEQALKDANKAANEFNILLKQALDEAAKNENGIENFDKLKAAIEKVDLETEGYIASAQDIISAESMGTESLERLTAALERVKEERKKAINNGNITDLDSYRNAVQELVAAFLAGTKQMAQGAKETRNVADQEIAGVTQNFDAAIENSQSKFQQFLKTIANQAVIESFAKGLSSIGQASTSIKSLSTLGEIWHDDTIDNGEKFFQIITNITMGLPTLINSVNKLSKIMLPLWTTPKVNAAKKLADETDRMAMSLRKQAQEARKVADEQKKAAEEAKKLAERYTVTKNGRYRDVETNKFVSKKIVEDADTKALNANTAAEIANAKATELENAADEKATIATQQHKAAIDAKNASLWSSPYTRIIAAIAAVVAITVIAIKTEKAHLKAISDSSKAKLENQQKIVDNATEEKEKIDNLLKSYTDLQEQFNKQEISLEELKNKTYDLCMQYNLQDLAIQSLTGSYQNLTTTMKEAQAEAAKQQLQEIETNTGMAKGHLKNNLMTSFGKDMKELFGIGGGITQTEDTYITGLAQAMGFDDASKLWSYNWTGNRVLDYSSNEVQEALFKNAKDVKTYLETNISSDKTINDTRKKLLEVLDQQILDASNTEVNTKIDTVASLLVTNFSENTQSLEDFYKAVDDLVEQGKNAYGIDDSEKLKQAINKQLLQNKEQIDNISKASLYDQLQGKLNGVALSKIENLSTEEQEFFTRYVHLAIKEEDFDTALNKIKNFVARENANKDSDNVLKIKTILDNTLSTGEKFSEEDIESLFENGNLIIDNIEYDEEKFNSLDPSEQVNKINTYYNKIIKTYNYNIDKEIESFQTSLTRLNQERIEYVNRLQSVEDALTVGDTTYNSVYERFAVEMSDYTQTAEDVQSEIERINSGDESVAGLAEIYKYLKDFNSQMELYQKYLELGKDKLSDQEQFLLDYIFNIYGGEDKVKLLSVASEELQKTNNAINDCAKGITNLNNQKLKSTDLSQYYQQQGVLLQEEYESYFKVLNDVNADFKTLQTIQKEVAEQGGLSFNNYNTLLELSNKLKLDLLTTDGEINTELLKQITSADDLNTIEKDHLLTNLEDQKTNQIKTLELQKQTKEKEKQLKYAGVEAEAEKRYRIAREHGASESEALSLKEQYIGSQQLTEADKKEIDDWYNDEFKKIESSYKKRKDLIIKLLRQLDSTDKFKTPAEANIIEQEKNNYYEIDNTLSSIKNTLTELKDLQADLTGEELAENLHKQHELTQQQLDLEQQRLQMLHDETTETKKQIEEAAKLVGLTVNYDDNGLITNRDALVNAYIDKVNAANQAVAAEKNSGRENNEEAIYNLEKAAENAEKAYKDFVDAIDNGYTKKILTDIPNAEASIRKLKDELDASEFKIKIEFDAQLAEVDNELNRIARDLKRVQHAAESLEGQDLINNLYEQMDVIDKQIEAEKKRAKLKERQLKMEMEIQKAYLTTLLTMHGINMSFGADGAIRDIEGLTKSLVGLIEKAEVTDTEIQGISSALAAYQSAYAGLQSVMDPVEDAEWAKESIGLKIQSEAEKMAKAAAKKAEEELNRRLKLFHMIIDVKLDLAQAQRQWNEYLKRVEYGNNNILENAKRGLKDFSTYYSNGDGSVEALTNYINRVAQEINVMKGGGKSSLYGDDIEQAMSDLDSYRNSLMSALNEIQDLYDDINDSYNQMIDKIANKLSDQVSVFNQITDIITHDMNLIKLINGEDSYEQLGKYYEKQQANNSAMIKEMKDQVEFWEEKMNSTEVGSEAWEKYQQNWRDAVSQLNGAVDSSVQNLIDKYQNAINDIFDKLDKRVTGGLGLDQVKKDWDMLNQNADRYLDTINAAYETKSLENKFIEAINGTDDVRIQERLTVAMEEQLDILREKDKISQYDIDRANAMYDLTLKQIALEEAQQNKSQMRLRRDSQGNYTYQFVADESGIEKAQQELLDAQNSVFNLDKDRYKAQLDEMYNVYSAFQQDMKDLYADQTLSDEQREQRREELEQKYADAVKDITQNIEDARVNLTESAFASLAGLYDMDIEAYKNMSDAEKNILLGEIVPQWDSGIQAMVDAMTAEGGLIPTCSEAFDELKDATNQYQDDLDELQEVAGVDFDKIANGIDENIDKTYNLIDTNNELIDKYMDELNAIQDVCNELKVLQAEYDATRLAAEAAVEEAMRLREAVLNPEKSDNEAAVTAQLKNTTVSGKKTSTGKNNKDTGNNNDVVPMASSITKAPTTDASGNNNGGKKIDSHAKQSEYIAAAIWLHNTANWGNDPERSQKFEEKGVSRTGVQSYLNDKDWIAKCFEKYWGKDLTPWYYGSFDTGGYTGEWGAQGKAAILHEKELVLNKEDTSNILSAVSIVRTVADIVSAMQKSIFGYANGMLSSSDNNGYNGAVAASGTIDQNVHIEASFPNVTNHNEIEEALNNLVNTASQRAMSTRR